jgi:hypothetical protein
MGRWGNGAITTGEVIRIELSYLLKNGFSRKGNHILRGLTRRMAIVFNLKPILKHLSRSFGYLIKTQIVILVGNIWRNIGDNKSDFIDYQHNQIIF